MLQTHSKSLLSPPAGVRGSYQRRSSNVMFSDVVLLHPDSSCSAADTTGRNVCSSEKMTQAGDGNIWQISSVFND